MIAMETSIAEARELNQQALNNLSTALVEMEEKGVVFGVWQGKEPFLYLYGDEGRMLAKVLRSNRMPTAGGTIFTQVGWGMMSVFCGTAINEDYPLCQLRLGADFFAPEPLSEEVQAAFPFAEEARQILRALMIPEDSEKAAAARMAEAYFDRAFQGFIDRLSCQSLEGLA